MGRAKLRMVIIAGIVLTVVAMLSAIGWLLNPVSWDDDARLLPDRLVLRWPWFDRLPADREGDLADYWQFDPGVFKLQSRRVITHDHTGPISAVRDVRLTIHYTPFVAAVAVLVAFPLLIRSRKVAGQQSLARRGESGVCGYDLRASTDRCPECGTPVKTEYLIY